MLKRKQHAPEFKAKVALEALKGEPVWGSSDDDPHMEAGVAVRCVWRVRARQQENARDRRRAGERIARQDRGAGCGQRFFTTTSQTLDRQVRRNMIEPNNSILSIGQQCRLLSISRSSFYYKPKGETEQNLGLMRRIAEQFLAMPFFGVR